MNIRLGTLFGLVVFVLAGCTSVELAHSDSDAQAKTFAPVDGKSVVYVVHLGGYGAHSTMFQVAINGQPVGALTGGAYQRMTVVPGKQTVVVSTPESERVIDLTTQAGSVDFVGMTSTIGMNAMRVGSLTRLNQSEGRAAVLEAKLARGIR